MAVFDLIRGNPAGGAFMLGTALVCTGLAILLLFSCLELSMGLLRLTKKILLCVKTMFIGRENTEQ